jgi:tetratricopeptide (TPR) repeat protein
MTIAASLLTLSAFFPPASGEGILCMKDGRVLDGIRMQREQDGVLVLFQNGEVRIPDELILDALVEGDSTYVPRTDEEKAKYETGLVYYEGKWLTLEKRSRQIEKDLAERKTQIEEMEEYKLWRNRRIEKTRNFEFEYTVPQHIYEHYRDLMEAYFTEFRKTWKIHKPKNGKLKVCFYRSREDFNQTSGAGGGVIGYFRFVEPYELNIFYERTDPLLSEQVMFHEANHYLQKLIDEDFKMPHFPGESLAEYYGAGRFDDRTGKLEIGLILEGRLTEVQSDIDKGEMMDLKEMILADRDYRHYTWGWTLVHFLMSDSSTAKKFVKFVMGLAHSNAVDREKGYSGLDAVSPQAVYEAFCKFLGLRNDEDVLELQVKWHAYVQEQLALVTPRGLEKAAMSAIRQYPPRPIRAKRLFSEAIAAGSTNPVAYHKYADLIAKEGDYGTAMNLWKQALQWDPLNASIYASMGRTASQQGHHKEGKRLVALAQEIEPDVKDDVWGLSDF